MPATSLISFVQGPVLIAQGYHDDLAESIKVADPLNGLGLVQTQAFGKVVMVENVADKILLTALIEKLHPDKAALVLKKVCFWPLGGRRTPSQVAEVCLPLPRFQCSSTSHSSLALSQILSVLS